MQIGIIGYGSMGKMFLEKFVETNTVEQSDLFISNRTYEKIMDLNKLYPKINIFEDNISVARNVDILFICVKPLETKTVLSEISTVLKENCNIVSLCGNILLKQFKQICINRKITRIYPSITGEVNKAVTLICYNNFVKNDDKIYITKLMECMGNVIEIPENEFGMGGELTSCMPGFIGAIFKVITDEAEKHTSISKSQIIKMLTETLYGTSKLLLEKGITFDNLMERVATKGGITEEGNKILIEKLPEIINEVYVKTMEKRRITTEKVQEDFSK
jgi:pyrroline-5-carboxylate reductase